MPKPTAPSSEQHVDRVAVVAGSAASISIVSESCVIREGLAALLIRYGEAEADTCQACEPFPDLPRRPAQCQIVLLDGTVEVGPTLDWIRECRNANPLTQIMVIELLDSISPILAYVSAGVRAYTLRGAPLAEIVMGIQALRQGHAYCSPSLTGRLFEHLNRPEALPNSPRPAGLSARELEVLHYLVVDYSNQQIAEQLKIDVRTVKHHVHNILQKLKVRHRWDAARLAQGQGWLQEGHRG
jgi:DNA-binding NarL/FixJ family response regulator